MAGAKAGVGQGDEERAIGRYARKQWGSVRSELQGEGDEARVVMLRARFDPATGERQEDEEERLHLDALLAQRAQLVARHEAQLAEIDDKIALYNQVQAQGGQQQP